MRVAGEELRLQGLTDGLTTMKASDPTRGVDPMRRLERSAGSPHCQVMGSTTTAGKVNEGTDVMLWCSRGARSPRRAGVWGTQEAGTSQARFDFAGEVIRRYIDVRDH